MKVKKPRVQLPPDKLNTGLLNKMSSSAGMATKPPPAIQPTLTLSGAHAKHFSGMKKGQPVNGHFKGIIQEAHPGMAKGPDPTASIQISHVSPAKKKKALQEIAAATAAGNNVGED